MNELTLLRWSFVLASSSALGVLSYAVGTAPRRPARHLGIRGARRTRRLAEDASFALFEPLLRFVGQRLYGLMDAKNREKLDRQLTLAGEPAGLEPEEVAAISLLLGVLFGTGGALYGGGGNNSLIFGLILGAGGLAAPYLRLSSAAEGRVRSISLAMPQVLDLLALTLGAGLDFPAALRQVVDRATHSVEPIYEELRLVVQDLYLGRTRRTALLEFAHRAPCEPVRELVAAVAQSEEQGTPLADVLRVQAATSRMHRSTRAEEVAAQAATKMMLPLILLFACVLSLIAGPIILQLMNQMN